MLIFVIYMHHLFLYFFFILILLVIFVNIGEQPLMDAYVSTNDKTISR